jgi:hypothetical protein
LAVRARTATQRFLAYDIARDENNYYLPQYGNQIFELSLYGAVPVGVQMPNDHGRPARGFILGCIYIGKPRCKYSLVYVLIFPATP